VQITINAYLNGNIAIKPHDSNQDIATTAGNSIAKDVKLCAGQHHLPARLHPQARMHERARAAQRIPGNILLMELCDLDATEGSLINTDLQRRP
jgi:hypothetical protein